MINKSPNSIQIVNNTISRNAAGEPSVATSSVTIACYVDFKNSNNLKIIKDGETVISKGRIYITSQSEIDKITFDFDKITFNSKDYNVLKIETGIKHLEIVI